MTPVNPTAAIPEPLVHVRQREALANPEGFWARAAEAVPWFKTWDRVFDWQPPTFRWFLGAQTNMSYYCLDHQVAMGRGAHTALIGLNERGDQRAYSYAQLLELVKQIAAGLRGLGIGKGDRVAIYMPTCPEAIALMLAATRIGAIHLVVFAGFGSGALAERIGSVARECSLPRIAPTGKGATSRSPASSPPPSTRRRVAGAGGGSVA